jgi:hypothetical protein
MKLARELNKRGSYRYNFLTNREVSLWNNLPQSAIMAESVKKSFFIQKRGDFGGTYKQGNTVLLIKFKII